MPSLRSFLFYERLFLNFFIKEKKKKEKNQKNSVLKKNTQNQANRGNVQNSLAKELYIVSYTTFETIKETSISSFRNLSSILELESKRLAGQV